MSTFLPGLMPLLLLVALFAAAMAPTLYRMTPPRYRRQRITLRDRLEFALANMATDRGEVGDGDDGKGDDAKNKGGGGDDGKGDDAKNKGGDDGKGDAELGFPKDTPVAEMTDKQAAAYWKHQSRKHEGRAARAADYDDVKAKAEKWDEHERAQQTPAEQAIADAEKRGREAGTRDSLVKAATAILRANLQQRGWSQEDIDEAMPGINSASFVVDGDVATDKVIAFANKVAGPAKGSDGKTWPDTGQGHRGRATGSGKSVAEVMAARAEARAAKSKS